MAVKSFEALDKGGNPVTVHDTDDPAEASDVKDVETAVSNQSSYDEINENPSADTPFSPPYNAIRLKGVDGDIEYTDGAGNTQVISQGFLATDEIIPITIQEIISTNTTQTLSDVMLLRE